jgi:hypothetical protein
VSSNRIQVLEGTLVADGVVGEMQPDYGGFVTPVTLKSLNRPDRMMYVSVSHAVRLGFVDDLGNVQIGMKATIEHVTLFLKPANGRPEIFVIFSGDLDKSPRAWRLDGPKGINP